VSSKYWFKNLTAHDLCDTQYDSYIAFRGLLKTLPAILFLPFLSLYLAGCSAQPTPYRPPTMVIQPAQPVTTAGIPAVTSQFVETQLPISTPGCTNNLTFLEDLSLPDGTVVKPGALLDKRWLVENSGTCNWDKYYRLKFMSGAELSTPLDQALLPARSGSKATIRIIFTAPSDAGTYQSAWQAFNPQGEPFGDPVFIQLEVGSDKP
jgi:hypothetical protein